MNMTALWEVIKEPLRLIVIAVIPVFINWVSGQAWNPEAILIAVTIIRAIDKMLHDYGVQTGNSAVSGGLTRF